MICSLFRVLIFGMANLITVKHVKQYNKYVFSITIRMLCNVKLSLLLNERSVLVCLFVYLFTYSESQFFNFPLHWRTKNYYLSRILSITIIYIVWIARTAINTYSFFYWNKKSILRHKLNRYFYHFVYILQQYTLQVLHW